MSGTSGSIFGLTRGCFGQVMEAKWAAMRFTPFLVIDPVDDSSPLAQDAEEYITQVQAGC